MEELEKRQLEVIDYEETKRTGIVVGCEYDVGITIIDKQTNEYLLCLHGPLSREWTEHHVEESYKIMFDYMVSQIKEEWMSLLDILQFLNANEGGAAYDASEEICPFGQ